MLIRVCLVIDSLLFKLQRQPTNSLIRIQEFYSLFVLLLFILQINFVEIREERKTESGRSFIEISSHVVIEWDMMSKVR